MAGGRWYQGAQAPGGGVLVHLRDSGGPSLFKPRAGKVAHQEGEPLCCPHYPSSSPVPTSLEGASEMQCPSLYLCLFLKKLALSGEDPVMTKQTDKQNLHQINSVAGRGP